MENPFDQLIAELKTHIDKRFKEMEQKLISMPEESGDIEWAAKYLNVTVPSLYHLTRTKAIKHHKPGKRLKFYRKDLEEYIQRKKVSTSFEIGREAINNFKSLRK